MKRRLCITMTSLVAVCLPCPSLGFMPVAPSQRPAYSSSSSQPRQQVHEPLYASVASDPQSSSLTSHTPEHLSHEEQQELLQQAVQLRTMKQIQQDLALRSRSSPPSQLVLARATGFGDDIFAYQDALRQGQVARDLLVTTNLGLVYYCVNDILKSRGRYKRSSSSNVSRDDLVQEGAIGLARAVDRWNLEIGGRFSTYAMYWVRAAVLRCLAEREDLVRVPEHVSAAVRKMTKAAKQLGIDIQGDSILWSVAAASAGESGRWKEAQAAKALAEEAGLTERQLAEAIKVRQRRSKGILSFESWMQKGQDSDSDLAMMASREAGQGPSDEIEHLTKTLSRFLRPKEMEALSWRYGLINENSKRAAAEPIDYLAEAEEALFGKSEPQVQHQRPPHMPVKGKQGEAMSFVEVGKKMQVSAEYTRRLVHTALDKLRRAADEGYLEPALIS